MRDGLSRGLLETLLVLVGLLLVVVDVSGFGRNGTTAGFGLIATGGFSVVQRVSGPGDKGGPS